MTIDISSVANALYLKMSNTSEFSNSTEYIYSLIVFEQDILKSHMSRELLDYALRLVGWREFTKPLREVGHLREAAAHYLPRYHTGEHCLVGKSLWQS